MQGIQSTGEMGDATGALHGLALAHDGWPLRCRAKVARREVAGW
jgi:hypothetical protein